MSVEHTNENITEIHVRNLVPQPLEHCKFYSSLSTPSPPPSEYDGTDWFRHQSRPSSSRILLGRNRAMLRRYC